MARVVLSPVDAGTDFLNIDIDVDTIGTVGTGDNVEFANTGKERYLVKQTDVSPHTIQFVAAAKIQGTLDVSTNPDPISIAAGGIRCFGPFKRSVFGTKVQVNYEGSAEGNFKALVVRFKNVD